MFKALGLTFITVGRGKEEKEIKNLAAHWYHTSVLSKAGAEKTLWPKDTRTVETLWLPWMLCSMWEHECSDEEEELAPLGHTSSRSNAGPSCVVDTGVGAKVGSGAGPWSPLKLANCCWTSLDLGGLGHQGG